MSGTKIYGASDDLIEVEGELLAEAGGGDEPALLVCSDGTLLEIKYGKGPLAVWQIVTMRKGELFERIEYCDDEDADPHSDVAIFKPGLKWVIRARDYERME